jgi:hypothetical protein
MALCKVCNKDFPSKRSTAQFCSPRCRKLAFDKRNSVPENAKSLEKNAKNAKTVVSVPKNGNSPVSVPINVPKQVSVPNSVPKIISVLGNIPLISATGKPIVLKVSPPAKVPIANKESYLCKAEGCYLQDAPGHNGFCIYHWRKAEGMPTIPEEQYEVLNNTSVLR